MNHESTVNNVTIQDLNGIETETASEVWADCVRDTVPQIGLVLSSGAAIVTVAATHAGNLFHRH